MNRHEEDHHTRRLRAITAAQAEVERLKTRRFAWSIVQLAVFNGVMVLGSLPVGFLVTGHPTLTAYCRTYLLLVASILISSCGSYLMARDAQ